MSNDIQIFNSVEFGSVRAILIDDEPYFLGTDVASVLGYTDPDQAIRTHVDDEDRKLLKYKDSVKSTETNNFNTLWKTPNDFRDKTLINESGVYSLILRSNLPNAKAFKRWVTSDVLPTIRKHGMYALPSTVEELIANPDLIIQLATQWKIERLTRERLAQEKHALQVELDESKDWYSVKRVANINHVSWKTYPWGPLVSVSKAQGIPPRKIFDANYGEVNLYHRSIWEMVYPNAEL